MREDRKKREALREKDRKRAEEQEKAQKEREVDTCMYILCQVDTRWMFIY